MRGVIWKDRARTYNDKWLVFQGSTLAPSPALVGTVGGSMAASSSCGTGMAGVWKDGGNPLIMTRQWQSQFILSPCTRSDAPVVWNLRRGSAAEAVASLHQCGASSICLENLARFSLRRLRRRDRPAADYPTEASTCGIPLHSGRLQVVRQPRHRGEECTYRGRASPVPTIRAHARLVYQECAERHWAFHAKLQSCRQSLSARLELSSPPPRDRSHAHVYSHLDREAVPWHRRT